MNACHSVHAIAPLRPLHGMHAITTFGRWSSPPSAIGTRWSRDAYRTPASRRSLPFGGMTVGRSQ